MRKKFSVEADQDVFLRIEANISNEFGAEDLQVFFVSGNPNVADIELTSALSRDEIEHYSNWILELHEQGNTDRVCGMTIAKADIECPNPNGRESA